MASQKEPLNQNWLDLRRNDETGIESINAHFKGHAYDAHDHDELLVGVTVQGLQRFNCHRLLHTSTPGRAILIEPGAVHDGHAINEFGFTYMMLYLPQDWVSAMMQRRGLGDISRIESAFSNTLTDDPLLITAIQQAFFAIHQQEGRLARDQGLDNLLTVLSRHIIQKPPSQLSDSPRQTEKLRDYLHENIASDVGLDELSHLLGIDRFRLSRQFKKHYGLSPHAYLVRLRLRTARVLLAKGIEPAQVANRVGFSDQSHMGRWFQRAYRLSPAAYQRCCTNILD
ncbi:AraC family transcriptional regulator [uncultured Cedecea sp.]|uniref:AraC family transcriptional regulator n=1 Tax=uncultured Cedecea sp. TaxID=988762 RepID=UPI0026284997|nr:AraC family transcriptional regulator [uncultured Cedecea sp.]